LAAAPQQLPSARASATVPQQALAPVGAGPQQPAAFVPAAPAVVVVGLLIVILFLEARLPRSPQGHLQCDLGPDAIQPGLGPARRGADLPALVAERDLAGLGRAPAPPSYHDLLLISTSIESVLRGQACTLFRNLST
jgi:hypothetical protein